MTDEEFQQGAIQASRLGNLMKMTKMLSGHYSNRYSHFSICEVRDTAEAFGVPSFRNHPDYIALAKLHCLNFNGMDPLFIRELITRCYRLMGVTPPLHVWGPTLPGQDEKFMGNVHEVKPVVEAKQLSWSEQLFLRRKI